MGNITTFRAVAILTLVLAATTMTVAKPPTQTRFAPHEILVKVRPPADPANGPEDKGEIRRKLLLRKELQTLHSLSRVQEIRQLSREPDPQPATGPGSSSRRNRMRGRLLLRRDRTTAGLSVPGPGTVYRIRLDPNADQDIDTVLAAYRNHPDVEYAELNPVISICATPSDQLYAEQWALSRIEASQAWDTCQGTFDVLVAVTDTGVDYDHRDLRENVWINETERNGLPGVDDDENGYVDDVRGYNFVYNNSEPTDDHGHGTHCAGTIAATGNNGLDIAGVCWTARIMPLKILGADGEGTAADAVPAIYYAVANGADIVSCSWGGEDDSDALREAIAYAYSQGVIVVAAAGNENTDRPYYPAAFAEVLSVAATDSADRRWYLSNYGTWVDLAAPGQDILSLRAAGSSVASKNEGPTATLSGTSMAAPHVSGACALLLSANPLLSCSELQRIITTTGDPISTGTSASNRRLNVHAALRAAIPYEGMVRMDRSYYGEGARIGVLLADWHLRGHGQQDVVVIGTGGDEEAMTLTETQVSLGVFRGELTCGTGAMEQHDGILQVSHGEAIYARYMDRDNGSGRTIRRQDRAAADFEPPAVLTVEVSDRGPAAKIELTTSEPTQVEIRYGRTCGGPYDLVRRDLELSNRHSIELRGLLPEAQHCFVVWLADEAGNETLADSGGAGYSFVTSGDFAGFRVPAVYPTIQAAIDDAWDGDTIWVADGTYSGEGNVEIDFLGKAITVQSENGPTGCIIDCQETGRAFRFSTGETAESILDGFTIRNGGSVEYGGGIRCIGSSPTIRNCAIIDSSATQYGGGLCNCYGSHPTVINCTFRNNACTSILSGRGGGIANRQGSHPIISNCTFVENSARYTAGAMGNFDASNPRVTGCTFRDNSARYSGGAVGNWDNSRPVFEKCVFSGNRAQEDGGAVTNMADGGSVYENCIFHANVASGSGGALKNYAAVARLTNCTISGNRAESSCGGVWNGAGGELHIENCILWANTDNTGGGERAQIRTENGSVRIRYCSVEGWSHTLGGLGSFGLDPLFVDPGSGDFHLMSRGSRWDSNRNRWTYDRLTSPCIDGGNPGSPLGDEPQILTDDAKGARMVNTRIDMGAYGGTAEASTAPPGWSLLADLDNSGSVDWSDLAIMAAGWAQTADQHEADLMRNGIVDLPDLAHLAREWQDHVNR